MGAILAIGPPPTTLLCMFKAALLLLTLALALLSCASEQSNGSGGIGSGMPDDFAITVSVLANPVDPDEANISRRPGRYVVLPDGTLRYGPDSVGTLGRVWLPPIVRTLSRDQMMQLWSLTQQVGLLDPSAGFEAKNLRLEPPPENEIVHSISLTAGERRWDVVKRAPHGGEPDPAIAQLLEHL